MSLLHNSIIPFNICFSPDTPGGAGGTPIGEMSKESMLEFLNRDDDETPIELEQKDKKDAKGDKTDKSEKGEDKSVEKNDTEDPEDDEDDEDDEDKDSDEDADDLDELEEDLEEPDEDKLELVTPVRRKEILKAYPDLFKKFPYLEKAYYREQQFTKVFPTVDDAKQAQEASESLKQMEADLMDGNPEVVMTAIKNQDGKSFAKLIDNLLPTLAKVDGDAYLNVVGNLIKHTVASMYKKGQAKGGDSGREMMEAAAVLNEFMFNTTQYEPPKGLSERNGPDPKNDEEKVKLQRERDDFNRTRFETARGEANTRINNSIKATIEANIDPKNSMSPYVKKTAVREVQEEIEKLITGDKRFKVIVDQLWKKASGTNFSKPGVDDIVTAFRSRARTLLLPVIKKARIEALKGMGKRVREDKDEEPTPRTRRSREDEPTSKRTGRITNAKDIPAGMTSREFLMSDD